MPPPLYDAHNHLAHPDLAAHRDAIRQAVTEIGVRKSVVNGTAPADWPDIIESAATDPSVVPAIGLHPWNVNDAPDNWRASFKNALEEGVRVIGEIGLDQWIEGHDIERQQTAFRWQLDQATTRNLPVSIHCLRAIGPMMDTLREVECPQRGLHFHAYNGSVELLDELLQMGTYFSFNAGQLKMHAKTVREVIRAVPKDRLLLETDAPDMLPPPELRPFELPDSADGRPLNHPANLRRAYEAVAELRGCPLETLAEQVATNFNRYFLAR